MDLYILDDSIQRSTVVDDFISLIWTERFNSAGDFELKIKSTIRNRSLFVVDTWLVILASKRIMLVKTIEDAVSEDGTLILTVKGPSLETILEDRVAKESMDDLTESPKWIITDTPGNIARFIFGQICVDGILSSYDIIPYLEGGSLFPDDTIDEPADEITLELEPTTVFAAIEDLCTKYELGFRLVRGEDPLALYFNIYSGVDRTSLQDDVVPLLFSPDLDNLHNQTEFTSAQNEKNVAYVFSAYGTDTVFVDGVDPTTAGFKRKILLVNATEITADTVDVPAALIKAGKEALAKSQRQNLFDGAVSLSQGLIYGVDYNLGDVVEIRNSDGATSYRRVTEFIFVSDGEGDRAYPTLSQGFTTEAVTWSSIADTIIWDGYDTEVWDDFG